MTRPEHKNLAASVRQRLLNFSQREKIDYQLVHTRYGIERLLYRLSRSPHHDTFVLKGAMLRLAWEGWSSRPTCDVDLLGQGDPSAASLKAVFEALGAYAVASISGPERSGRCWAGSRAGRTKTARVCDATGQSS